MDDSLVYKITMCFLSNILQQQNVLKYILHTYICGYDMKINNLCSVGKFTYSYLYVALAPIRQIP